MLRPPYAPLGAINTCASILIARHEEGKPSEPSTMESYNALRWWGSTAKLSSMNRKELEERVDEILLKRTRGEKLTRQEEKILAYTYHAASQRRTIVRMRPRRES